MKITMVLCSATYTEKDFLIIEVSEADLKSEAVSN